MFLDVFGFVITWTECITHLATRTFMKCNKRQISSETKPNKQQKMMETIMKNATQLWCSSPIHLRNPLQFLQLSSHCINDTFMEASQVHCVTTEQRSSPANYDDRHFQLFKASSSRKSRANGKDVRKNLIVNEPVPNHADDVPVKMAIVTKTSQTDSTKSEPPPLAFYPKNRGKSQQPIIFSATEPPPLVPIANNFT